MIQSIEVCPRFSVVKKDQRNSLPFHPSLMSFCTKGLPGVAESTAALCEEQPSPWGEGARQGGWGVGESALPGPSPTICDRPSSPGIKGLFFGWWILRLRLRLRAEWQGEGGGMLWKVKVLGLEKQTKREPGIMCIEFLMMLCVLVKIVAMSKGIWLIHDLW